jgi:hypothetical protein
LRAQLFSLKLRASKHMRLRTEELREVKGSLTLLNTDCVEAAMALYMHWWALPTGISTGFRISQVRTTVIFRFHLHTAKIIVQKLVWFESTHKHTHTHTLPPGFISIRLRSICQMGSNCPAHETYNAPAGGCHCWEAVRDGDY